jgi:hypothetical protein
MNARMTSEGIRQSLQTLRSKSAIADVVRDMLGTIAHAADGLAQDVGHVERRKLDSLSW